MSDKIKKIDFNKEEMCRFIKKFNPTLQKYLIEETSKYYNKALRYDDLNKSVNLKKNSVPHLVRNADLIYGNARQSIDYGQIYKDVLDRFLLNYVSIPDLGSLFDAQYMDFEWSMHSDLNFNEHRNSYYRDHFIHQVRNLFMTFKLLENAHILDNVKRALTASTRSKVTQYFKNRSNVWVNSLKNNHELYNLLRGISREKKYNNRNDFYKDYFCEYVIRGSLIISSLFHDIGYPVAHYLSVKERMINFIPAVYSIMGVNNFDFNYIYSLLSESVLFKFVGKDMLYKRFLKNDHGTMSALLLGVFFYKTGLVHSLSIEKQTAIELGMLAIYNHTLILKKVNPDNEAVFTEIVFSQNPISYLLRWCDDMQEWDREYFEIASLSNLLFCSDCKTPLRKAVIQPTEFFKINGITFDKDLEKDLNRDSSFSRKFFSYSCMCHDSQNYHFTKRDDFNRRMLLQIKACDNLSVIFNDTRNFIFIDFQYDPYKLLRLANIHPSFIRKRQKEISCLKKFLSNQQFFNEKSGYKFISIKHSLSPNPIYLKMLIIKDFFEKLSDCADNNRNNFLSQNLLRIHNQHMELLKLFSDGDYELSKNIKEIIDSLANALFVLSYREDIKSKPYYDVIYENCKKYIAMMLYQTIVILKKCKPEDSVRKEFKNYIGDYCKDDTREILVSAALDKIESYIAPTDVQFYIDTKKYVKDVDSNDFLFTVAQGYCNSLNKINQLSSFKNEMTYYTDLYMYEILSYQTELFRKHLKLYQ